MIELNTYGSENTSKGWSTTYFVDIISSLKKIKGLKIRRAEAVCKRLGLPRMQGTTKGGYGSVPLFVYLRSEPFFSLPPLGGLSMRDLRETSEMDLHEKKPTLRIPETRFAPMASLNKRPKTSEIIPCGDLKPQEPVEFELNKEVSRLSALHNLTNSISSNSALDTLRDKEQSLRTYIYPITHLASGHPFVYQKGRIAISRLRINSLFVMHNNNRLNPSLFGQDSPQLIRYCPILPNSHTEKDAKKTFSIDRFTRLVNISTSSHLEFKINYLIEFLRAISLQNRYASARFVSYDKRAVDNREEFHKDQPNLFESNFFSPYRGASSAYPKGEPILADTGHTRHVSFLKRHEVDSKTRPLLGGNTAGIPQASPMLNQIDITHNSLSGVLRLIQATTVMRMHSIGIWEKKRCQPLRSIPCQRHFQWVFKNIQMVTEQAKIINDLRMFPKHLENRINRIFKYLAMQDLADYKQRMSLNLQAHESFNEFSLFRTQNKKLQMSLSQLEFFPSWIIGDKLISYNKKRIEFFAYEISSTFKGRRLRNGYPVRGQRTRSNARTARLNRVLKTRDE